MVVLQHEHSLCLIDLNPMYPHDEQVYDDEEDLIIKQAFQSPCNRCHKKITYLHRYYYKCDQCDFLLHKLCAELPTKLEHASHIAHTLTLFLDESQWQCHICKSVPRYNQLCYHCSQCSFNICLDCSMDRVQYNNVYHPSHKHPLTPMWKHKEMLIECDACGKDDKGVFYQCATCFLCFIHKDCVFKPKRLSIQDGTCGRFFHIHPLILTYSFPKVDQEARFHPLCMVCDDSFSDYEDLWAYKCDKCRYYVHLHCSSLKCEPSNSVMDMHIKSNLESPNVVRLPLLDRTYNKIKDFFLPETNMTIITHDRHEHPLILVDTRCNDITTSMNKVEILCDACVRPIFMDMPFYKCTSGCNFILHDWCTRLPAKFKDQRGRRYTLIVSPRRIYSDFPGLFNCYECRKACNGFAYSNDDNGYMDVNCAIIPFTITHPSHPRHVLYQRYFYLSTSPKRYCRMCLSGIIHDDLSYSCGTCNFRLHLGCALLLPITIRHKYDKHPMALSYRPIENHDGDYFCEVCEEELNPHISFYHCRDCVQSIHTTCAPLLIPQSLIQKLNGSIHKNIKYGAIHRTKDHQHPLSVLKAAESVRCIKCDGRFWKHDTILKCLQCEFAIHGGCSSDLSK